MIGTLTSHARTPCRIAVSARHSPRIFAAAHPPTTYEKNVPPMLHTRAAKWNLCQLAIRASAPSEYAPIASPIRPMTSPVASAVSVPTHTADQPTGQEPACHDPVSRTVLYSRIFVLLGVPLSHIALRCIVGNGRAKKGGEMAASIRRMRRGRGWPAARAKVASTAPLLVFARTAARPQGPRRIAELSSAAGVLHRAGKTYRPQPGKGYLQRAICRIVRHP